MFMVHRWNVVHKPPILGPLSSHLDTLFDAPEHFLRSIGGHHVDEPIPIVDLRFGVQCFGILLVWLLQPKQKYGLLHPEEYHGLQLLQLPLSEGKPPFSNGFPMVFPWKTTDWCWHQELMGLMEDMSHEHEAATGSRWDRFQGFTGWFTGMGWWSPNGMEWDAVPKVTVCDLGSWTWRIVGELQLSEPLTVILLLGFLFLFLVRPGGLTWAAACFMWLHGQLWPEKWDLKVSLTSNLKPSFFLST